MDADRRGEQVSVGGMMVLVAAAAGIASLFGRAARTGHPGDWNLVGFGVGMIALLSLPFLALWLWVALGRTANRAERETASLVAKVAVFLILWAVAALHATL
jgi:hypothetical protein